MPTKHLSDIVRHLGVAALAAGGSGPTDGQLLESFVSRRDGASLGLLVRRHVSMV